MAINNQDRVSSLLVLISNQLQKLIELQEANNTTATNVKPVEAHEHVIHATDLSKIGEVIAERFTLVSAHITKATEFVALKEKKRRLAEEFKKVNDEFYKACSSRVYVAHIESTDDDDYKAVVSSLSGRGFSVVGREATKRYSGQIKQAQKQDCRYIWFFVKGEDGKLVHEVKDIYTGEQVSADPHTWVPEVLYNG